MNRRTRRAILDTLEPRRLLSIVNKVADVNQATYLDPSGFVPLGASGVTLFSGRSYSDDGKELWRTDGTAAGTYRVKDIVAGKWGSYPTQLTDVNGTVFFTTEEGPLGNGLWKSNGAEVGTVKLLTTYSRPRALTSLNGKLYFIASDTAGTSLWTSDGTPAGTVRCTVANFTFAADATLVPMGNAIYFGAVQLNVATFSGNAFFKFDPAIAGPGNLSALRAYPSTVPAPGELRAVGDRVFFNAQQTSTSGGDLWISDGTSNGTALLRDVGGSSARVRAITPAAPLTYFVVTDSSANTLWRTDGTGTGTFAVTSSTTTLDASVSLTPIAAGAVLFPASRAATGFELYRSDGTTATTVVVKDILAGSARGVFQRDAVFMFNGVGYFPAYRPDGSLDLWKTDGTAAGTTRITEIGFADSPFGSIGDKLALAVGTFGLPQLWTSDGTAAGTAAVGSHHAIGNASSMFDLGAPTSGDVFTRWGTSVLFAANDGIHGSELWISNASTGVTQMRADIEPGLGSSLPAKFTVAPDNSVLFTARSTEKGTELYRLLPSGQVQLAADVDIGSASSEPDWLRAFGFNVYYAAKTSVDGRRYLYRYDVSALTNTAVRDAANARLIPAGPLMLVGGNALFCAAPETAPTSSGLYSLTASGGVPVRLRTLNVQPYTSAVIGSSLYFVASDGTNGYELWKSDGSIDGTSMVANIGTGGADAGIGELASFNNRLYFGASTDGWADKLYISDGTSAGTAPIAEMYAASDFTPIAGKLYFLGQQSNDLTIFSLIGDVVTPVLGNDGLPASATTLVAGGPALYYVRESGQLQFEQYALHAYRPTDPAGSRHAFAHDLWRTDFTSADLSMRSTWDRGARAFTLANNRLYFPAYRPEWGVEPHSLLVAPIATTLSGSIYWDRKGDGIQSANDTAARGVTVYLDFDRDGTRDADEPTALTNASGSYSFSSLEYGEYLVRPMLDAGWSQTSPAATATLAPVASAAMAGAIGLFDSITPTLTSLVFDRDASRMQIRASFDDALDFDSLSTGVVSLVRDGDPLAVPFSSRVIAYDAPTRAIAFSFPGYANGVLPDGRYRAVFNAGSVADAFGNLSQGTLQIDFNVFAGDADGDADVDFDDLLTLSQNYNQGGRVWSQGDFNYDGNVNFDDLLALAQHYGQSLPALSVAGKVASPAKRRPSGTALLSL